MNTSSTREPRRLYRRSDPDRLSSVSSQGSRRKTGSLVSWLTAVAVVAGSSTSVHAQNLQDSGVELPGVWAGDATWGDYDRDGDQDLVLIGEIRSDDGTCRRIARVMRNDDGLLVEDVAQSDRLVGVYFGEARWADTDGDGDLDLAIAGWDENGDESLRVYTNDQGASESDRLLTLDLNQINDDGSASLTGVRYADMAWGDPDRDGDLDLVVTGMSAGGTSLTRLYANDRGRLTQDEFNSEALLNVHNGDIAWADIDNDGDLDLSLSGENVIADGGLAAITEFYANDTTGTLTLEQGIDLGSDGVTGMSNQVKRGALSWSDFDGDGNLDLALSGRDAALNAVLKIFRNRPAGTLTEDGSFFLNRFQRVDGGAHWIDYDNDGDADLAVVGRTVLSNHQAFVFENRDGELSGVSVEEDIEGLSGGPTVWGDYDGDGRADLLITGVDADGQRQSILYSSRVSAANRAPEAPASLNEVTATSQRVLFSWSAGSDVESANLSYNVRIGTEPAEQDILSAEVPLGPGNAGLKSDYVLGSFLPPDTYFWSVQTVDGGLARSEFTAEGRFTVEQFVSSDQRLRSLSHSSMAWSDFDGDGDDDLALMGTNRSGEARTLLYANEEGTLSLHTDAGLLGLTKGDVAWADIDGDGDLDLFSGGQIADDNREDILYRVSGEGLGSTFDPAISFSPALDFSSAQFGDVDLDGDLDLVYAGQSDSVENNQRVSLTTVWLNDGDGGYSQGFDGVEGVNNGDLELADLDGDGDLDLLLTGAATDGDPRTLLYRNDHPLDFIDTGAQIQALKSSNLALGDVDRDGDLDLALGGLSASGLYAAMFTNDGGVLTQREDVALPGIIAGDFTWADYDNDQDLDLIVSGNNGATSLLQVFENTIGQAAPDSAFELLTLSNLSGVDFSAVSAADPDGDGDLDLISSGRAADFSPSSVVNDNLASQQFNSNVAPNAASTLVASDSADDVRLSWQPGSDDGAPPVASLSYNVRIGSESEGHDILSGARPLGRGNAGHNLFVDIEGLDSDTYFWSVQTIDAGGVASPWSTQSSFIVDTQSPSLTSLALNRSELGLGQTLTLNIGFADAHAGIDAAISPTVTATVADQGFEVLPLQFTGDTWTGELTITDGIPSGAATISVAGLTDLKGNVLVPVDSTGAFLVDADRPAVVASDPADGADSVTAESGASVTVTFSEPLDPATVLASNFAIRLGALSIASTATYVEEPDAITVALVPEGGLLPGNEYSVEAAAGIADLVGNVIGQSTTWSFRTQIPNLTETIPPASADSVDAAASVLSATFDTQVLNDGLLRSDAVRILREGVEVALRQTPVFDVPSLSLLFEPEGGLRPGSSYQVTLTGLLGGPLRLTGEGDYSWAFTTRLASPTEFSPARGDTGVPVTTSGIRVTFDAGIDPVVLASDDSAVQLFREGQLVDIGSPSYDPDARALSFGPTVGFLSGSTYRVVLDSELRGPQAAGEIDWSFRTQIPEVVSTTPTDAASITSDPRRISVTFSSPVDSAGRAPRNFRLARGGRPLVLAANEFLYDPATFTVSLPSVDLVSGSEYTVAVSGRIGGPQSALTDHLFTFRTEIPTVSSTEPADGDEGIGTSQGLISVDFSSPIANQSAEGFSLRSRSLDAADTTFVVLPITGFGADSTQTHINFAPEGGFRAFTEYEVIVDRRALGPLAEEGFSWRFSTAPRLTSISDGGTVSNADGSIELYLPPNALSGSDGEIAISPVTADDGAGRPVASQQTQVGPAYRIDAGSATLRKPATLTIGYDTDDLAGANAARLGIFALADGDVWTRVGGTVDEAARTVTTTVPALGTFGVFEDTGAGLGSLAVADVDCQPRAFTPAGGQLRDRTDISFDLSAPADVTVRVYNVSGRVERVLSRDRAMAPGRNTIVWDGRDDDADVVASGLYVVVVSVAGAQAEKVVAVVR